MSEDQEPVKFPNYPQGTPWAHRSQAKPLLKMIKLMQKPRKADPFHRHQKTRRKNKKDQE